MCVCYLILHYAAKVLRQAETILSEMRLSIIMCINHGHNIIIDNIIDSIIDYVVLFPLILRTSSVYYQLTSSDKNPHNRESGPMNSRTSLCPREINPLRTRISLGRTSEFPPKNQPVVTTH